jgi:hypothetical protein
MARQFRHQKQFFENFKMKNMKVSFRAKEQSEIGMSLPFELQS